MKSLPILILEDDENDQLFLKVAFKAAHMPNPLEVVHDGQEAIDYLAGAGKYSDRVRYPLPLFAILDLKTPRKTGLDVLKWIRSHAPCRRMVVIMLTASANHSDVNAAYAAGVNAFLVKPAGIDRLTEIVRAIHAFWVAHNRFPADVDLTV